MGCIYILDKVDPHFRHLTDLLFFTDRTDVDWSNYRSQLDSDINNYTYLWDRFIKGTEILWSEDFWIQRLDFLFSLQNQKLQQDIEDRLDSKFRALLTGYGLHNTQTNYEYVQFMALVKTKAMRNENLVAAKKLLLEIPNRVQSDKLVEIIKDFIPALYPSLQDYGMALSKEVSHSVRAFSILEDLEKRGVPVNKDLLHKTAIDLFFTRTLNRKNRSSLFNMMKNDAVRSCIKNMYTKNHRDRLMALINQCDFREIENWHLINIKSILDIDSSVADELVVIYADKLHNRGMGSKKANIDRIIRVLKAFPQCSPKKVLAYLSNNNRMSDIKYLMKAFPNLRKLAAFI